MLNGESSKKREPMSIICVSFLQRIFIYLPDYREYIQGVSHYPSIYLYVHCNSIRLAVTSYENNNPTYVRKTNKKSVLSFAQSKINSKSEIFNEKFNTIY